MSGHSQCVFDYSGDQVAVWHDARCQLDDLLVSSLDTAFALPEMRHVPRAVTDDLHFDVAEAIDGCFLGENLLRWAFFNCSFDRGCELFCVANESDTPTSTSVYSLDHDWIVKLRREALNIFNSVGGLLQCRRYRNITCDEFSRANIQCPPSITHISQQVVSPSAYPQYSQGYPNPDRLLLHLPHPMLFCKTSLIRRGSHSLDGRRRFDVALLC